jgi:REP element-mobilizing transposase RayT
VGVENFSYLKPSHNLLDIGCPRAQWTSDVQQGYNLYMRKTKFAVGEYYHVYNRGTDKRDIFMDEKDLSRFYNNLSDFNKIDPIGSVYELFLSKKLGTENKKSKPLVKFVAYCLNPNHFHLLITPVVEQGIEKFMQRLGNGYTKYFNNKYKRSGVLFQGKFKSKHVDSNEYLLHLSVYINANNQLNNHHGHPMSTEHNFSKSSLPEFLEKNYNNKICDASIILDQFRSLKEYKEFFDSSFKDIVSNKEMQKELEI